MLCRLIRPSRSAAFSTVRRPRIWHRSFSVLLDEIPDMHASLRDLRLCESLGVSNATLHPGFFTGHLQLATEQAKYKWEKENYAVVHPFSRWSYKELTRDCYAKVISGLIERGFQVVITGARCDSTKAQGLAALVHDPSVHILTDETFLRFTHILKGARVVVTIDTVALHLAQALQIPVVAIFGPTNENVWGPRVGEYRTVFHQNNFLCRPCGRDGCDGSKRSLCLEEISPKEILCSIDSLGIHGSPEE